MQDTEPIDRIFGVREFAETYLLAQASDSDPIGGYHSERTAYNTALREYRQDLLAGLQQLFGTTLTFDDLPPPAQRQFMLFTATARSCLATRTPGSYFTEGGLLITTLERSGPLGAKVLATMEHIGALTTESRAAHLDTLEALLTLIVGDAAERTFTTADLAAVGVATTAPRPTDYPWDFE